MEIDWVYVFILLWYRLAIYFSYTVNMLNVFVCILQCHHLLTPSFLTVGQGLEALMSWPTAVCVFVYVWLCEWVLQHPGEAQQESCWPWPELILPHTHTHAEKEAQAALTCSMRKPGWKVLQHQTFVMSFNFTPSQLYFTLICSIYPLKLPSLSLYLFSKQLCYHSIVNTLWPWSLTFLLIGIMNHKAFYFSVVFIVSQGSALVSENVSPSSGKLGLEQTDQTFSHVENHFKV